jgi:hypothetical protein
MPDRRRTFGNLKLHAIALVWAIVVCTSSHFSGFDSFLHRIGPKHAHAAGR